MIILTSMGIKGLKTLLNQVCQSGIYHYQTIDEFLSSDKLRLYHESAKLVANNPVKKMKLKKFYEKKPYIIGVDTYLYACRYKRVFERIDIGFLRQIIQSLSHGMIPLYVFDGTAPEQKQTVISHRRHRKCKNKQKLYDYLVDYEKLSDRDFQYIINYIENLRERLFDEKELVLTGVKGPVESRCLDGLMESSDLDRNFLSKQLQVSKELNKTIKRSISIEHQDIINIKKLFDILHIPYIVSAGEADDLISILYQYKIIDACQSDDMDMLPKGCGNLIQISSDGVTQFLLSDILADINLTHQQFVDLCILLGCDYYTNYLPKLKAIDLFNIFKDNPSLGQFVENYSQHDNTIKEHLQAYIKTRQYFVPSDNTREITCNLNEIVDSLKSSPLAEAKCAEEFISRCLIEWHVPPETEDQFKSSYLTKHIAIFINSLSK